MKRAVLLTVENHLRQYRRLQRRQDREARAWCDAVRETLEEYETGGEPMKARLLVLRYFDGLTEEPVEVLSMYDGMSCGHIALDKLGVDVTAYYATEIDKYAIQTTQHNFPDTVQLGDAFQVRDEEWRPRRAEEAE